MVVENHRTILREEVPEGLVGQGVRVVGPKDHQVSHVHDTDAQLWNILAQQRSSCDDLKRQLDADANQNTIAIKRKSVELF